MKSQTKDQPLKCSDLLSVNTYHVPPAFKPYLDGICFSEGTLNSRVEKLAWDIADYYNDQPYIMLVLMKGAIHFSSVLNKHLANIYSSGIYKNTIRSEFIKVKSYFNDKSTGKVSITGLEAINLENKNILIIEDIIDSGLSMKCLLEKMTVFNPKSIKICVMISRKPSYDFNIDFLGIDSAGRDHFFVGFGLDYNEFFRDLTHLACLNEMGIKEFKDSAN